jgi:hypothetical protein
MIGFFPVNERRINDGIKADGDAPGFDLDFQVFGKFGKFLTSRRRAGQIELAAKTVAFFIQGDRVPPVKCGNGCVHAGSAAADDHDLLGSFCFFNGGLPLIGRPWIAQAFNMLELEQIVKAPLGAGHAMDDFIFPARLDFFRQVRVCDQAAAHGHHVAH